MDSVITVGDELADVANIAILASPMMTQAAHLHEDLLTVAPVDDTAALHIAISETPRQIIDTWTGSPTEDLPAEMCIINVGGEGLLTLPRSDSLPEIAIPISIATVSSPGDLTGIGMKLSRIFEEWTEIDHQLVVCVNDLTSLLQYTDLPTLFRFLQVITGQLRTMDAVTHYHLNPEAHDDQTINTLLQLFDAAITCDEPGDWRIIRR